MRKSMLLAAAVFGGAAFLPSQAQAILFTGRFPFVSLDAPNERPGGAITQLTEYDFSYSIPIPGASPVRTLLPATAMHCYLGDGNADGNYLKLRNWKDNYFQAIAFGVFVKAADRANVTFDKVYFTPAYGTNAVGKTLEVLTNGGTPVVVASGDWIRLLPNGNVDYFMTAAQLAVAVGVQSGTGAIGAGALAQASNGDLYYAPIEGGHWVNGNQTGTVFAQDGAICKIDAANITYDPLSGNVLAFAPNSARILINEAAGGPGGSLTIRTMATNSGAMDRTGSPLVVAGVYGKNGGLAIDPNGGTWQPVFPDAAGSYGLEPNLLWCSNAGSYGGTIWTTNNNGEVAVLNGRLCGSVTPGVPADGAWLGVQLDINNFQPTLLGMTVIDLPSGQPLIADMNDFGRLPVATSQPSWDVDFFGTPGMAVFSLIALGPQPPSLVVPSLPAAIVPLSFAPNSWPDLFLTTSPLIIGFDITNASGYATVSVGNPNNGSFAGATIMVQGLALTASLAFQLSSPVLVQLQ